MMATDIMVHKMLSEKFLEIVKKHNNPVWAIEELEWLIFDKHGEELGNAPEEVQAEVRSYMMSINKLYK